MVWRSSEYLLSFLLLSLIVWQTFNVLWATLDTYLRQGLISDSKVLDIRQVDVRLSLFTRLFDD